MIHANYHRCCRSSGDPGLDAATAFFI